MTSYNYNGLNMDHFQIQQKETIEKLLVGTLKILSIEQRNDALFPGGPLSQEVVITCIARKSEKEILQDSIKRLEEENRVLNEKLNSVAKIFKEDDGDEFLDEGNVDWEDNE